MSDRGTPIVISPQEYKATQISESKRQSAENRLDEGEEGGKYEVDGQMVNANGELIRDKTKEEENRRPVGRPPMNAGDTKP